MQKLRGNRVNRLILLVLAVLLAACSGVAEPRTDPLQTQQRILATNDLATQQVATQTAAFEATRRAEILLTPIYTATPTRPANIVTPTPRPTIFSEASNDILGNVYVAPNWLNEQFADTNGDLYTMNSFTGSVIFIQLLNTDCQPCVFQQIRTRSVAQLFYDEARNYDIVYITLNLDPDVTQRELQNWATRNDVPATPELRWYVGNATPSLRAALEATFGDEIFDAESMPMIVIDPAGNSHLSIRGTLADYEVRDVLIFYADPPQPEELPPVESTPTATDTSE